MSAVTPARPEFEPIEELPTGDDKEGAVLSEGSGRAKTRSRYIPALQAYIQVRPKLLSAANDAVVAYLFREHCKTIKGAPDLPKRNRDIAKQVAKLRAMTADPAS